MTYQISDKLLDNKVRIRNQEELDTRKSEFLEICKILDSLEIRYFLLGGVLLGAIRNKGFIPWDWDVEICVYSDEVIKKIDPLLSVIAASKFSIIKYNKKLSEFKIDLLGGLPKEVTKYTIMGWVHNKKKRIFWRKTLKIPEHFLNNMVKIELFNKFHFAPYPPKEYLTHQYGDWQIPMQTSNKKKYLTKKYYGRNVLKDFVEKVLNFIKRFMKKFK
jgi:phosphorylcholine metabolism protein LicD